VCKKTSDSIAILKRHIHIRKAAETAYELALTLMHENCSQKLKEQDRFWAELHKLLEKHLEKEKSKSISKFIPMSDSASTEFGNQIMPYGEYKGMRIDEVPKDRLQWYADQTFTDDLRMYLESDRIKNE
jgi:hypothetical protein